MQCGATSRFTLCRQVLYKYCRVPKPVSSTSCLATVNVRCSNRDRAQKARCVQFALKQCLAQAKCVPFFNDTATTEIYTLPLPDALPI